MSGDLYISADIEADGPIPGPYSMLSFGLAVAGSYDGEALRPAAPEPPTFYRELKPISARFEPEALAVSGLDRDRLCVEGCDPPDAMGEAKEWIREQAGDRLPVMVAYPAVFDWMFMYWYFVRFAGGSPFGVSGSLDMKTMFQQKARVTIDRALRTQLPPPLRSARPHTHHARDDALEQAEIFVRLFEWKGEPGP
ncbi:MAG TPA: hypothetical protein VD741_05450 [Solirubrobacterales bacterium]|nr:hypothetical protein [Solirubrobacterales bacterium]